MYVRWIKTTFWQLFFFCVIFFSVLHHIFHELNFFGMPASTAVLVIFIHAVLCAAQYKIYHVLVIVYVGVAFSVFISVQNWNYTGFFGSTLSYFLCSYLSGLQSWCSPAKNPFCLAGRKEGEEALMKISADLSTFEIVLFKSTMACIHTYFIVHAQRGNGNYLCGPRREGDKGKEK